MDITLQNVDEAALTYVVGLIERELKSFDGAAAMAYPFFQNVHTLSYRLRQEIYLARQKDRVAV